MTTELRTDADGFVLCPRRGRIDVEWCLGCPHTTAYAFEGDDVLITCEPPECAGPTDEAAQLRQVPDLWRSH